MRLVRLLLLVLVCFDGPALAGPFEDAIAAYAENDNAKAIGLLRPLAEQGDAKAQVVLGNMYYSGHGVRSDKVDAVYWYRKAAEQGDAAGQTSLGEMYANGQGVPQDYAAAVSWYRKAAEQGFPGGQFNLGKMYEIGRSVPQDYVQAHMWLNLAASRYETSERGDSFRAMMTRALVDVASKMTPAQIAKAQDLASEWKPESERRPWWKFW